MRHFSMSKIAVISCVFFTISCTSSKKTSLLTSIPQFNLQEPFGWSNNTLPNRTLYIAPEKNADVSIVTIGNAKSSEEAAVRAWQQIYPTFQSKVLANIPEFQYGGWDEIRQIEFETTNTAIAVYRTVVFSVGDFYYVILVNGDPGTLEKQDTAVDSMIDSFALEGYQPEDLSTMVAHPLDAGKVQELVSFIDKAAQALQIPGAGIALVENGRVLYEGGVGVRDLENKLAVTKDTKFMIASNTKGLTTLLLSKLVEMNKLKWDDAVTQHYPKFILGDKETTKLVQIQHLVCACTGLPRKDLDWIFNDGPNTPTESVFQELASTKPTSSFGDIYQYNNQMAAAAGYIAGHIIYPDLEIGTAYDKAFQEYILNPLEMTNTTFSTNLESNGNYAKPYAADVYGNISEIAQTSRTGFNLSVYPHRPAGALWSTSGDMIKYVNMELTKGLALNGERIFSESTVTARREPKIKSAVNEQYGMGLAVEDYNGIEIISHGGALAGFKSNFFALTKANVGGVVLTNSDEGYAINKLFKRKLIELLYETEQTSDKMLEVYVEKLREYRDMFIDDLTHPASTSIISKLAPRYQSNELGNIEFRAVGNSFILDTGVWQSTITTKVVDNQEIIITTSPGIIGLEFELGMEDKTRILTVIDGQHIYKLTEIKE